MNTSGTFENPFDNKSHIPWLFPIAPLVFVVWVVIITFYLSRVLGLCVSFLLNRYLRLTKTPGHLKLGSISISLLGGKIMFREFVFANEDYSIRCNDGWIIFSYWKAVPDKNVKLNDQSSRLHLSLNGLQLHLYNRVHKYKEIAKLFHLEKYFGEEEMKKNVPSPVDSGAGKTSDRLWALFGMIKLDIWSGRVVVGNRLLPYMFVFSWENMASKIQLQPSAADKALLAVEGQMESIRVSFMKHPDYQGKPYKDPPRTMGDGFAIMQSAHLSFYYHQDILGYVTDEHQSILKKDAPVWESIFRFGSNTVIGYGPWAEQQRALIYAFFFPPDYQTAPVTEIPTRGQRRINVMHDVRVSFLKESAIDIWFMRGDQLESIHTRCQPGSTVDLSIWWLTKEEGFSWSGQISLLKVISTTSLVYRKLLECETFRIECEFKYPRVFNAKQTWKFNYSVSKATAWFVWDHKRFIADLINEWVGDATSDVLQFIPYTVSTDVVISDGFELILLLNDYNWVDPSEMQSENVEAAVVGDTFSVSFLFNFVDFLPETLSVKYSLLLENEVALRLKYPTNSATSSILAALLKASKTITHANPSPHGNLSKADGWFECWRTERLSCVIDFKYHPIVPEFRPSLPYDVYKQWLPPKVDHPSHLEPDNMNVVVDIDGSEVIFTGLLIRFVIDFKNNYFGYYDSMTSIEVEDQTTNLSIFNRVAANATPEQYRPMDVDFEMRVHNIRAQCLVHSSLADEPCPVLFTEEIVIEVKKMYQETFIQVGVGQCAAHFERSLVKHEDGFLSLSGLQFRGHALFSELDVPWDMGILEYGWMMEVLIGDVNGSLNLPNHLVSLIQILESLILLTITKDDEMNIPARFNICQHGELVTCCRKSLHPKGVCEGEEKLKYRQLRLAIDGVRLALCEERTIIDINVDPLRFTLCNTHEGRFSENLCLRLPVVTIRQIFLHYDPNPIWLQVGKVQIAGVEIDIELPQTDDSVQERAKASCEFIRKHDIATKRLLFLWEKTAVWGCACYGNTKFFANKDQLGTTFLIDTNKKYCKPVITEQGQQPGFLQDLLRREETMLHNENHYIYAVPNDSPASVAEDKVMFAKTTRNSIDTSSFHSAASQQMDDSTTSMQPQSLITTYATYLTKVEVIRKDSEPPKFGEPGALANWAQKRTVYVNTLLDGICGVKMRPVDKEQKIHSTELPVERKPSNSNGRKLVISGTIAKSIEIFISPLAIEAADIIVNYTASYLPTLHPATLIQSAYRDCIMRNHRQPLTESLFTNAEASAATIDVGVDLPMIHLSIFQCGLIDYTSKLGPDINKKNLPVSTNIVFMLIHGGSISTTQVLVAGIQGTSHVLHCNVVSAQLLQLLSTTDQDFVTDYSKVQTLSIVDWKGSEIAKRASGKNLKLVFDFQIPDMEVSLVRSQKQNKVPLMPVNPTTQVTERVLENKTKIEIGTIKTLIAMARPLDRTGKQEFPIYDVLAPAITSWLNCVTHVGNNMTRLSSLWEEYSDMSLAKIMKLALECTDESVLGHRGRNLMEPAKRLGKHQSGCPTCLLLHILFRYSALPSSSGISGTLAAQTVFKVIKNRKVALQALLSHWQPDICRLVKLVSNAEASKYRVDAPSDGKNNETRITIEPVNTHRRTGSAISRNAVNNVENAEKVEEPKNNNLYLWILNAHRERNEGKGEKGPQDPTQKDYLNPMDILPKAFFYSFYRTLRLDWTQLDDVPVPNQFKMTYTIAIHGVHVDLLEPKMVTSSSLSSEYSRSFVHRLIQVKLISVAGDVGWKVEMDDRNLMPIRGKMNLNYRGTIEDVQFMVALSSICLAKEIILVCKAASDCLTDLARELNVAQPAMDRDMSVMSTKDAVDGSFTPNWEERVLDFMKDFEKGIHRSGETARGNILTSIRGLMNIDAIKMESQLTDLYISFDMRTVEFTQEHNPGQHTRSMAPHEVDILKVSLRKAKMNIRESITTSGKSNDSKPVVHCSLKESSATLDRKLLAVEGVPPKIDSSLAIYLGAIEGELPMVAHSLHDVVMRHGPELEQQFNRLSAQPKTMSQEVIVKLPSKELTIPPSEEPNEVQARRPPVAKVAFKVALESIELKAKLLPSLLAMYKLRKASSTGETGSEAKWMAGIEDHHAEFYVSLTESKSTDSFTLALPSVNVKGQYLGEDLGLGNSPTPAPTTDKQLHYRKGGYLKMDILLGQVNHSFTTDLLNHILFAEQSFRSELSALIQRLGPEKSTAPTTANSAVAEKSLLFFLTIKGQGAPWLQLTAATPTATAVRFTIDSLDTELTNRWVVKEEGSARERLFGAAVIQFNAKLGQLVKLAQYEEIQAELQEYATFMTQIRVENKESSKKTYSYHISLNRPFLMLKASAIDKGILLWLNYKNTYDYWRAERTKFERETSSRKRNSLPQTMFSPTPPQQDFDINLFLAINNGMYVCMPLISNDVTEGMPALVLSLQKSDVSVTIRKELVCRAQFHSFKLNFIDNFDERSLSSLHDTGDAQSNFFFFPQGQYHLCSKASNQSGDAQWILSVRSRMRGMVIDLDNRIGKLTKMLVNTLSTLGEDDEYVEDMHSGYVPGMEEHAVEGGAELSKMMSEDRIRWLERKIHEQSKAISDAMLLKDEETVELERAKLRKYELIRFKEFRRSMIEKLRKKNDKGKRPSVNSEALPVPQRVTGSSNRPETDTDAQKAKHEAVNMHIDVQVSIESGSCTLKTVPKTDVNVSGSVPLTKRPSARDLRSKAAIPPSYTTKFSIPSVDLKGYYVSVDNLTGTNPIGLSFPLPRRKVPSFAHQDSLAKQKQRGCIYLALALSSMPSETVVTPHLADYVEQVLEPLPIATEPMGSVESLGEAPDSMNNIVAIDTSVLPLDVLFYVTVQSSTIRFDGQQQQSSAADCLLKLPCLTLMASTRRTEDDEYFGGVDISATLSAFSLSIYSPHQTSNAHDALSLTLDHLSLVISRSKNASSEPDNRVRFVLTSNIGSANFNYDMRRLGELMQFPKPWYRRAIVRRIFFGDQAARPRDAPPSRHSTVPSQNMTSIKQQGEIQEKPWSATVLLAVQWKELNVNAQMSNTMGTTTWKARKGLLRALAKLNSRHERDITLTFLLDSSELVAHGGAISGEVSLNQLVFSATHRRQEKSLPRNNLHFELASIATRIEWMSRAVLIGKMDKPSVTLSDEMIEAHEKIGKVTHVAVMLNIKAAWEDLQIVINKNTIDDFQKIVDKLKNFFQEQLNSSRKAWQFHEDDKALFSGGGQKQTITVEVPEEKDVLATDHWERVLDTVTEIQYNLKLLALPKSGQTVVGGTVQLVAGRISLACMHGEMNASSWALFHLRQLSIIFKPEAQFQYVNKETKSLGVSVRQQLTICLGDTQSAKEQLLMENNTRTENMANVCRAQQGKNSVMRQNSSIVTSLEFLIGDVLKQIGLGNTTIPTAGPTTTKAQHNVLELFQFPALKAVLTTLQCNECDPDVEITVAPEVISSFVCEFYNLVYVQTDFSVQVSFLPELLKSYIHASAPVPTNVVTQHPEAPRPSSDNREYKCENWEVNPKIGFIDRNKWNPPLVDDILRKLQIFDHRTTIPKALQRAVLDPLDTTLAVGLSQLLKLVDKTKEDETSSKKSSNP